MPPAGRGLTPCTPFTCFLSHHLPLRPKRSIAGRARAVGCLTEPKHRLLSGRVTDNAPPLPKTQGRKALRGPRESSGSPCPARDEARFPPKACLRQAGDASPAPHSPLSFLTPSAPPQAFRRGPGKGCRLFDRAQASFASRPRGAQRSTPCPKLKAGKHYEARESVPAALVRPATGRVSRQKHASGGQKIRPLHPSHVSAHMILLAGHCD
jgi:hypothetical protein